MGSGPFRNSLHDSGSIPYDTIDVDRAPVSVENHSGDKLDRRGVMGGDAPSYAHGDGP
ncbi:MAG: hypothetical protein ACI9N0_002941 [Ilumatobacter sp.]|jgi:hypothetical protein